MAEPSPVQSALEFHRTRKRKSAPAGEYPVRGFGPEGAYTLYLVLPAGSSQIVFEGGRARRVSREGSLPPEILALAEAVIGSFRRADGHCYVDLRFLDYAAGLIRLSYDVDDADLQLLLLSGNQWHDQLARHLFGSEGAVSRVARMPAVAPTPPAVATAAAPLKAARNNRRRKR